MTETRRISLAADLYLFMRQIENNRFCKSNISILIKNDDGIFDLILQHELISFSTKKNLDPMRIAKVQ